MMLAVVPPQTTLRPGVYSAILANAWLGNFRHLAVRYDRSLRIYKAFFLITHFMIVLGRL